MKKSSFFVTIFGTISGVIFALGMCMALIPEWKAFQPGIIFGVLGLLLGFITYMGWRRMENKAPIQISPRTVMIVGIAIVGILLFGVGMCFSMIWHKIVTGVIIGLLGIIILLCLIPMTKGLY